LQYRPYGKTGWNVSLLGMGCMRLPRFDDGKVDREKAYEIIRYAADHGVNYFDTAFGYHGRTSEEILGEALADGRRERVIIATKQPFFVMKSKDEIRRNLENTLTKLRTSYVDAYLIHNVNAHNWQAIQQMGVLREYEKFREEGLIKAIAFSYHGGYDTFAEALSAYDWDMCQVQHNFMDWDREVTRKGIELAGQKGCALVVMEPIKGGNLAKAPDCVKSVYEEYPIQREPVEWAFRYAANFPQVSCILSGMTTLEQLKQNIEIFSQDGMTAGNLSEPDLAMLAKVRAAYESVVTIPCTGCEYCMPCPHHVNIPGVFEMYNTAKMFDMIEPSRRTYMFITNAGANASHCEECGECEPKCPQGIKIISELKTAHEALKGWVEI